MLADPHPPPSQFAIVGHAKEKMSNRAAIERTNDGHLGELPNRNGRNTYR